MIKALALLYVAVVVQGFCLAKMRGAFGCILEQCGKPDLKALRAFELCGGIALAIVIAALFVIAYIASEGLL